MQFPKTSLCRAHLGLRVRLAQEGHGALCGVRCRPLLSSELGERGRLALGVADSRAPPALPLQPWAGRLPVEDPLDEGVRRDRFWRGASVRRPLAFLKGAWLSEIPSDAPSALPDWSCFDSDDHCLNSLVWPSAEKSFQADRLHVRELPNTMMICPRGPERP